MGRFFLLVLLSSACAKVPPDPPVAAEAPEPMIAGEVIGSWQGQLSAPGAILPVILHVEQGTDGLSATMDSPSQGAFGLPVSQVEAPEGRLVLDVASIQGAYEGRFTTPDRIEGTWSQGGVQLPLALERVTELVIGGPERPQDPREPFPYEAIEVRVPSAEGITLAGTLTLPEGAGPFPGVVLISGSGPQDRDESLMGHRPFAVLADHLTRQGIAVVRYDDRGVGASTGDFAAAITPDHAADAAAVMAWLRAREEISGAGYVGHSEGALAGPIAHETAPADFLVLIGGPAVRGAEILIEQSVQTQLAEGVEEADAEASRRMQQEVLGLLSADAGGDEDALREQIRALLSRELATEALPPEALDAITDELLTPWMRWFVDYDPLPALQELAVPVLALYGSLDVQVSSEQNAGPASSALAQGTVEVLEGLNHLLQPATTGAVSEYGQIETTMDPAALERIAAYVLEQAR